MFGDFKEIGFVEEFVQLEKKVIFVVKNLLFAQFPGLVGILVWVQVVIEQLGMGIV